MVWQEIFSHEKQGPTAKLLYPAKLSFRIEGQIRNSPNKRKLKDLFKKKKIKTMNKMAINTYLSTIESKKRWEGVVEEAVKR